MVEITNRKILMPDVPAAPDQSVQQGFEKTLERNRQRRDRREEAEQLARVLLELLPPMPELVWRTESEAAAGLQPPIAKKAGQAGIADFGAVETEVGPQGATSVKRPKPGVDASAPLRTASAPRVSLPDGHAGSGSVASGGVLAGIADATDRSAGQPAGRRDQERAEEVRNEGQALASSAIGGGGAKPEGLRMPLPSAPQEQAAAQGMNARAGARESGDAQQGWVYNFRSWGDHHAVRISPQSGAAQQLWLQPSSSLVEQRLGGHAGAPGGSEQWILQEHRDQQHESPRQQRQEQEDNEQ